VYICLFSVVVKDFRKQGILQRNFVCVHPFGLLNLFFVRGEALLVWVFLDVNSKCSSYLKGEIFLKCTTQDDKGLVFIEVFFTLYFDPHKK